MASSSSSSFLILFLDGDRLRADGLHLGSVAELSAAFTALGLGARISVKDVRRGDDLTALAQEHQPFDVVVAVGHSNEHGIRVSPTELATWETFGSFLRPLGPRRLVLVACRAGCWPAAEVLFRKLPKLRRIFASPVNASKDLATLMIALAPYLVANRVPRSQSVAWTQAAAVILTGRQIRQWTRVHDYGNPAGMVLDIGAAILDPYAQQVPGVLRALLGGTESRGGDDRP